MSGEHVTPCARPDADPNDWFIEKDGRQYDDEVLVTVDELLEGIESLGPRPDDLTEVQHAAAVLEVLTDDAVRKRLILRRQARDACHVDCYFRLTCLDKAMTNKEDHGTWGGYYPEQRRAIMRAQQARVRPMP